MVLLNLQPVLTSWLLFSFVLLTSQMSHEVFFLKPPLGVARAYTRICTRPRARAPGFPGACLPFRYQSCLIPVIEVTQKYP